MSEEAEKLCQELAMVTQTAPLRRGNLACLSLLDAFLSTLRNPGFS